MTKKTILFLPSNKNHVLIFLPIYEILKKNYHVIFLTQGSYKDENAEKALSNSNIKFLRFDNDQIKPKSFLSSHNIGALVVGNDSDIIPLWFINTCKSLEIPTVLIQDGLMFNVNNCKNISLFSSFLKSNKKLLLLKLQLGNKISKISYGESNCTQIHIWGKAAIPFFIQKNVPLTKLILIGYPKSTSRKNSSTYTHPKTILYAPTALTELGYLKKQEKKFILNSLIMSIKNLQNIRIILKPHPAENNNLYHEIFTNSKINFEISNDDFSSLITKTDLVISDLSTVSLESLSFGIPVIIFLPNLAQLSNSDQFPNDLIQKNIFLYANNVETLSKKINSVLSNSYLFPNVSLNYLNFYFGNRDNSYALISAKNIAKLIT